MPHHFTKDVPETYHWCNKCGKLTLHIVSGGRLGRCKEHEVGDKDGLSKEQRKRREKQEEEKKNPRLF